MIKKKALYFYVGKASFVKRDLEIFSTIFELKEFNFEPGAKWKTPFQLIQQLLFLLFHTWKADAVIIQLAGYHSFLPAIFFKLAGKKSYIIASGTDCHSFPSIGYGNYRNKLLGFFTKLSFSCISHIVPKHKSLWYCDYTYNNDDYQHQGIKFFNAGINKPFTVIENGYDAQQFRSVNKKEPGTFLTVAGGMNFRFQKKLKGIDLIIEAAKFFPANKFTIVGVESVEEYADVPENVILHPPVPNNLLPDVYSSHFFYLQLSMAEGFPNALCEAMLCECTPIGSDVFSIPEIISDTGYVLKRRDADELRKLIETALIEMNPDRGKKARLRISENYSLENRKKKFRDLFGH